MHPSEIHALVYKLFTYVPDSKNYGKEEHWTSHYVSAIRGEPFADDCDGFALTCAEWLMDYYPLSEIAIAYCITETGEGHLVCLHKDLVLDNRYNKVYSLSSSRYKWKQFMYMDNKKWVKSPRLS